MYSRPLNIGIVCYPTYGGSGVVATELGKALAQKGHQIHFISYKRPARLTGFQCNVYYHEVSNFEYPLFEYKPYDTALASKIVDIAIHHRLDILHVHYAIPHAIIAFIAKSILQSRNIPIKVITTLHGTDITLVGIDSSFYPVVEFSINQSDAVTTVSESLKQDTIKDFNIHRDIQVIPNFIDFSRFNQNPNTELRKLYASDSEKIIMHISNFRKVKRIPDIVQSFAQIDKQLPSKLLLIGDGPERNTLEELTQELKIKDRVLFFGKQESVEDLLNIADLFILASDHESFGLSALEAMACGVPVVSSRVGGLPEVNKDGYSGYSFEVGNIEQMTEKSIAVLSQTEKHNEFRKNAIQQAKQFDIHKILPLYLEMYYDCLNKK